MLTKTEELCPSFLSQAREISIKFEQIFKLFAACHFVYDSADYLKDGKIDKLKEKNLTFMENMNTMIRSCLKSVPPFLVFFVAEEDITNFFSSLGKNSQTWLSHQSSICLKNMFALFFENGTWALDSMVNEGLKEYTPNSIPSPNILTMWKGRTWDYVKSLLTTTLPRVQN